MKASSLVSHRWPTWIMAEDLALHVPHVKAFNVKLHPDATNARRVRHA